MEKPDSDDDDDIKTEIKAEPLDAKSKKGNSKSSKVTSKTSNISEQQPSTSKHTVSQNLPKKLNLEKFV